MQIVGTLIVGVAAGLTDPCRKAIKAMEPHAGYTPSACYNLGLQGRDIEYLMQNNLIEWFKDTLSIELSPLGVSVKEELEK